jgi:hypothetical protein
VNLARVFVPCLTPCAHDSIFGLLDEKMDSRPWRHIKGAQDEFSSLIEVAEEFCSFL